MRAAAAAARCGLLAVTLLGFGLGPAVAQTFFLHTDMEFLWSPYAYATEGDQPTFVDMSVEDGPSGPNPAESHAIRVNYQSWGAFGLSSPSLMADTAGFKVEFWMATTSPNLLLGSDARSLGQVNDTAYYQLQYVADGSWQRVEVDLEEAFGTGEWTILEWRHFRVEEATLYLDGIRVRQEEQGPFKFTLAADGISLQDPYADPDCYYTLHVTDVPVRGAIGLLTGFVQAPSSLAAEPTFPFKIALYIYVESFGWVSKPTLADPYQDIAADGSWAVNYASFASDVTAEIFAVFLVKESAVSEIPILNGEEDFSDAALRSISVAYLYITRGERAEVFSGATYLKKEGFTGPGPGNLWTSSPDVAFTEESVLDEETGVWNTGPLHLGIEYRCEPECGWYCTEYEGVQTYGYGRYHWIVKGRVDQLASSAVLGLFTFETPTLEEINNPLWGERELDIEFAKFEGPEPWDTAFLERTYVGLSSDEDVLHCIIDWQAGQVNFAIYLVEDGSSEPILITERSYDGEGVPTTNAECINMNLWIAKWTLFPDDQIFDPVPIDFVTPTENNLSAEILAFHFTPVSDDDLIVFPKPIDPGSCQNSGSSSICVASGVYASNDPAASAAVCEQAASPQDPDETPPELLSPPPPPVDLSTLQQVDIIADGQFQNSFIAWGITETPREDENGVLANLDGAFFVSEFIYNATNAWVSIEYEILPAGSEAGADINDTVVYIFSALQPPDLQPFIEIGNILLLEDYTTSGVAEIPLADFGINRFNEIVVSSFDFEIDHQIRIESLSLFVQFNLTCEGNALPASILEVCGDLEILRVPCTKFSTSFEGTSGPECIVGTEFADTINAGTGADIIFGLQGDDVIDAGGGRDVVYGGGGKDQIIGGVGADKIFGGPGNDVILGGTHRDIINGGTGKDFLTGGAGKDVFRGCKQLNNQPQDTLLDFNEGTDTYIVNTPC